MGLTSAIISGVSTAGQFAAQRFQANSLDRQADFDASITQAKVNDTIARGNYDASRRQQAGRQLVGAQRAAAGASGIDPNVGTPAALQIDEAKFSALDALTIQNNAARTAWGYSAQSQLNQQGLRNEAQQIRTGSYSTILTGASNAARYGLTRRGTTVPTSAKAPANDPIADQWWRGGGY